MSKRTQNEKKFGQWEELPGGGRLYRLGVAGHSIGPMDVLIAATALENDLPLVTDNPEGFQRVPRLSCLTWCGETF